MKDESSRIQEFFSSPPFAVVGASNNPDKYGYKVLTCYMELGQEAYPVNPREEKVQATLSENLGFRGRMLVVDLGEVETVRLRSARLSADMLQLRDVHHRLLVLNRSDLMPKWEYHGFNEPLRYDPTSNATSLLAMSENTLHQVNRRYGNAQGSPIHFDMTPSGNFVLQPRQSPSPPCEPGSGPDW